MIRRYISKLIEAAYYCTWFKLSPVNDTNRDHHNTNANRQNNNDWHPCRQKTYM